MLLHLSPAPAAPVPVVAATRLAYVLRHFGLAYPGAPAVTVGYAATAPAVEIAELSAGFFAGNRPYPAAPAWREWGGRRVPFFFDDSLEKPLLIFDKDRVIISADIISAAFYLLSGWQEYFSDERDRHGRFPYAASVQQRYNFVTLPVVNYYFDVLRTAVEHVGGQPLRPRRWGPGQAGFAAFVSHDVDNMRGGWKAPAKAALRRGKLWQFGRLLAQHLIRPDPWDNLEAVAAAVAQYGAKPTFFVLPAHRPGPGGTPQADYRVTAALRQQLARLQAAGCEIGLHGSLGTAANAEKLQDERQVLGLDTDVGLRLHYLAWEPRRSPGAVSAAGVGYDCSLGFAEHFGFRHSYCLPFYPFDFKRGQATGFLEIPLHVMDTTLHHPNYLQLTPAEIMPALTPVFAEVEKFGGVVSLLWHNQNFDPANGQNGPHQFAEIMGYLQQQGTAFRTGHEICAEFFAREPQPPTP